VKASVPAVRFLLPFYSFLPLFERRLRSSSAKPVPCFLCSDTFSNIFFFFPVFFPPRGDPDVPETKGVSHVRQRGRSVFFHHPSRHSEWFTSLRRSTSVSNSLKAKVHSPPVEMSSSLPWKLKVRSFPPPGALLRSISPPVFRYEGM